MALVGKLVTPSEPGDPISAVFVDDKYVISGSLLGRIWVYNIEQNTRRMLAGFSDDAVRGIHYQDGTVYATIGDYLCKHIRLLDPYDQLDVKFDRRSSGSGFKYVVQKFNQVTVFYPGMTTFIDVVSNTQSMCPFKMQQAMVLNVCPIDSYQYNVLFSEFAATDEAPPPPRKFKLVDVSTGDPRWECVDPRISAMKLIDQDSMVYFSQNRIVVYSFVNKAKRLEIKNFHKSAVITFDCSLCMSSDERRPLITSLGANGTIVVFDYFTGRVEYRGKLKDFSFSLGFPYLVQSFMDDNGEVKVAVSCDYGVHYVVMRKEGLPLPPLASTV